MLQQRQMGEKVSEIMNMDETTALYFIHEATEL